MAAELKLQTRQNKRWTRGLGPLLKRENRKWWGSRRWWVSLLIWVGMLNGLLAFALYILPQMAAADGMAISADEAYTTGVQMFFGLGIIGLSLGAIVMLQDAIIEEKATGTAEWVLSKPVSRTAFVLAKLLPNLLGMVVTMLIIPGTIGYVLLNTYEMAAWTTADFLTAYLIIGVNLLFYVTLTLMLGVFVNARPPLLGITLASLFGGSLIPLPKLVQFTPWKLGELVVLPMMGQALPPIATTMLVSTAVWSVVFLAVAIWRMNRLEF